MLLAKKRKLKVRTGFLFFKVKFFHNNTRSWCKNPMINSTAICEDSFS